MANSKKIIIEGITQDGQIFRPSDWAERLSGELSTFRNRRIIYSPFLQPSMRNGHKCVILDSILEGINAELYYSIIEFAETNRLRMTTEQPEGNPQP